MQLRPTSGDRYLPTIRRQEHEQGHSILHNLRIKKANLWGKEYAVTGALGVASNPLELAETAFLQFPTIEAPNKYHIYQGTGCSRAIEQEHIPSWWVVLALVLQDTDTVRCPMPRPPQCPQPNAQAKKAEPKSDNRAEWFRKGASYYRYLTDVDQLVDNKGAVIKQALAIAPDIPYIVVAGTPCQDLTTIGKQKGALKLAGTRSIYFYTFHLTLHYLQEALPPHKIMYVLENAASMKAEYRQTIQLVLSNSGRRPHLRKRYYFTNSNHTCEPTPDPIPWNSPPSAQRAPCSKLLLAQPPR